MGARASTGLPLRWLKFVLPRFFKTECPGDPLRGLVLDFAFVNVLTIANSEDKNILLQYGINHSVVTDTILSEPSELTLEHRIGFRLFDQFLLDEIKNSFRLRLR
jgi:hypothetical protein